jgi:hypothetical protein
MKMKKCKSIWKDENGYHTGKEPAVVKDIHTMRKRSYSKSLHELVDSLLQKERQSKNKLDE